MKRHLGLAMLAASLACGEARASGYTAIYSFGDSLSDVGNVYNLTGQTIPIPPYSNGRFSNGANWLDDLSAKLGLGPMVPIIAPDGSNNPGGNDYAFGGAQTGPTNVNAGSLIDLVNQAADFSAASPSGALFTLDIGANDIGNALTAYAANPTTFDLSAFLTGAIENTVGAIDALYVDGMRNLLYFEVPDLSVVPAFKAAGPLGGELAMEFNDGVLAGIANLEAEGLTVFDVPVFDAIDALVNNPGKYGFTNVTDPCFSGDVETTGTECSDPDKYLFWDKEHPTAAGYALTAELADAVLTGAPNPITAPEPSTWAMMLIGFGGLGLAGWRRSRRAPVAS
jgi:phospholipase/lecithinase/hemolysin